ncbi:MAG: carboxypeptidase-like regulatory domain-containing protein [Planctomycetaceae bacterium]|nr:carboxypeptidase-like regulatory domain-containing protein [Planctomycetaceae bacterium]
MCFLYVLAFLGCKQSIYVSTEMVEGTVTLDGVPVSDAEVTFYPVQLGIGISAMGRTDTNGVYRLSSMKGEPEKGTVLGDYNITVSKYVTKEIEKPYFDPKQDAVIKFESKEIIPLAYTDVETSPLMTTVTKGKNVIDLKLDSNVISKKKKH